MGKKNKISMKIMIEIKNDYILLHLKRRTRSGVKKAE